MKYAIVSIAVLVLGTVSFAQPTSPALTQVVAFWCNQDYSICPDGMYAALSPVQLSDGNLYVPTWYAGQGSSSAGGTVFRTAPSGQGFVVHTFQSSGPRGGFPNGAYPVVALLQGPDSALYGVTLEGGAHNFGVFYRLTRTGAYQVLYNFCSVSGCPDGPGPVTLASDGNFYGAGSSTIFRMTPQGVWSVLHALDPTTEGTASTLMQASDGNFYGTGALSGDHATIFRVTPAGQFTILQEFSYPVQLTCRLIQASDGNLYGATNGSGPGGGIFRMDLAGNLQFIHEMTDNEGFSPVQLLQASDGNIWGLSDYRDGSFFAITLDGVSITSAPFTCGTTGCTPQGMIEGRDGNFYGSAMNGGFMPGKNPIGTVFKIAAGLGRSN